MKRGYFIAAFILLCLPLFYSQQLTAQSDSEYTVVVGVPDGGGFSIPSLSSEIISICNDGRDNEGITVYHGNSITDGFDTLSNERGKIDCCDQSCQEAYSMAGRAGECVETSACSSSTSSDDRPKKCTGNNLEYADGALGEITNLGPCPYRCVDEGDGAAHCIDRPATPTPTTPASSGSSSGGGGGCTRRSSGGDSTQQTENTQASCNGEILAEYSYDGINTNGWKFEVTSGVPTMLVPRLNPETQQSEYTSLEVTEHPASVNLNTEKCNYYYFAYQREGIEMSEDLQNIPDQTYVDETGTEHCVYDISSFRDKVAEVFFGAATGSAKMAFPDTVSTYEPTQNAATLDVDGLYVWDETIISDPQCPADYEPTFEFTDSSGTALKHCVLRQKFSNGQEFTYNSYLVNNSVYDATDICNGGGVVSGVPFRAANDQFAVLCVEKKVVEKEEELIIDSLISENNCPAGFTKTNENINLDSQQIAHCISSSTSFDKSLERNAKRTERLSSLDIDVCPDLVEGTREDTCDGGCCPTQSCEANIPEGPRVYYGLTLEPQSNCLIDEANRDPNGVGLPITNVDDNAQSWLDQCMELDGPEEPSCTVTMNSVKQGQEENNFVVWNNQQTQFAISTLTQETGYAQCSLSGEKITPAVEFSRNCNPLSWTPSYDNNEIINNFPYIVTAEFNSKCEGSSSTDDTKQKQIEVCPTQDIDLGTITIDADIDLVEANVNAQRKTATGIKEKTSDVFKSEVRVTDIKFKFDPAEKTFSPEFNFRIDYQKKTLSTGEAILAWVFGVASDDLYIANFKVVRGIMRKLEEAGKSLDIFYLVCEKDGHGNCETIAVTPSTDPTERDREVKDGRVPMIENWGITLKLSRQGNKNILDIFGKNGNKQVEVSDAEAIQIFEKFVIEREPAIDKGYEESGRIGHLITDDSEKIEIFGPSYKGGKVESGKWKRVTMIKNPAEDFNSELKTKLLTSQCVQSVIQSCQPNQRCIPGESSSTPNEEDSDGDGVLNDEDNCKTVPNGPEKGLCIFKRRPTSITTVNMIPQEELVEAPGGEFVLVDLEPITETSTREVTIDQQALAIAYNRQGEFTQCVQDSDCYVLESEFNADIEAINLLECSKAQEQICATQYGVDEIHHECPIMSVWEQGQCISLMNWLKRERARNGYACSQGWPAHEGGSSIFSPANIPFTADYYFYNPGTICDTFDVYPDSPLIEVVDKQLFCVQNMFNSEIVLGKNSESLPTETCWKSDVLTDSADWVNQLLFSTQSPNYVGTIKNNFKKQVTLLILEKMTLYQTWMKGYYKNEVECNSGNVALIPGNTLGISCKMDGVPETNHLSCTTRPEYSKPTGWFSDDVSSRTKNTCQFSYLPAHTSLQVLHTGTCADYSVAVTALLRLAGLSKENVMTYGYSTKNPVYGHAQNLVRFPGETRYTLVDTTGNRHPFLDYTEIKNQSTCPSKTIGKDCFNDFGKRDCPTDDIIRGCDES